MVELVPLAAIVTATKCHTILFPRIAQLFRNMHIGRPHRITCQPVLNTDTHTHASHTYTMCIHMWIASFVIHVQRVCVVFPFSPHTTMGNKLKTFLTFHSAKWCFQTILGDERWALNTTVFSVNMCRECEHWCNGLGIEHGTCQRWTSILWLNKMLLHSRSVMVPGLTGAKPRHVPPCAAIAQPEFIWLSYFTVWLCVCVAVCSVLVRCFALQNRKFLKFRTGGSIIWTFPNGNGLFRH